MTWAKRLWGQNCFRIPTKQKRGPINIAVLESVGKAMSLCSDEFLEANFRRIIDDYQLLLSDPNYVKAVTSGTGTKTNVYTRFTLASRILA